MLRSFAFAFLLVTAQIASAAWKAGVARADITPCEPTPLAGYSGNTRMHVRVLHPIWIKALALTDEGGPAAVLVTSDLVGLSEKMISVIANNALTRYGIARERLILNASHNHSCPVTEDVLWLYYELTSAEALARDRYTAMVYAAYDQAIGNAIADLKPADLKFEQGLAGVAVNRRRARGPESRALAGPVDQDVPVMTLMTDGQVRAVVFGYSCHTTALSGLDISGDYAGFAQIAIERSFPGAVAMFVQNCGGDANPLPRLRGVHDGASELAAKYGDILGEAVCEVIKGQMTPLKGPFRAVMSEVQLPLQPGPTLEELRQRAPNLRGLPKRAFEHLIRQYETTGGTPSTLKYPVQVWRFGSELTYIALTGETVVDYSLKFKEAFGWNTTWVSGYNNDLLCYVPSLRVLGEGGYEGATGMYEYGHRAPFTKTVEENITVTVQELVKQTREPR
jgi:hypothetical protein